MEQRGGSIRELRSNNIHGQKKLENSFHKPNANRNQKDLDRLYFKPGGDSLSYSSTPGQRIQRFRNASSAERVFGLDQSDKLPVASKGKRQVSSVASTSNLISGYYGRDPLSSFE